jgi:hypothetical protein
MSIMNTGTNKILMVMVALTIIAGCGRSDRRNNNQVTQSAISADKDAATVLQPSLKLIDGNSVESGMEISLPYGDSTLANTYAGRLDLNQGTSTFVNKENENDVIQVSYQGSEENPIEAILVYHVKNKELEASDGGTVYAFVQNKDGGINPNRAHYILALEKSRSNIEYVRALVESYQETQVLSTTEAINKLSLAYRAHHLDESDN